MCIITYGAAAVKKNRLYRKPAVQPVLTYILIQEFYSPKTKYSS